MKSSLPGLIAMRQRRTHILSMARKPRLEIVDNAPDMGKPAPTQFAAASPGSGYVLVRFVLR